MSPVIVGQPKIRKLIDLLVGWLSSVAVWKTKFVTICVEYECEESSTH